MLCFYIKILFLRHFPPKEHFSKQKGYLDDELDYRKQSLDHAHKVRTVHQITHVQFLLWYAVLPSCAPWWWMHAISVSLSVSLSWRRCCLTLCSWRRRVGRCPSCWASRTGIRWETLWISGRGRSWVNYEREMLRYSERGWNCCNMLKRYILL